MRLLRRFLAVLDMEGPPRTTWTTACLRGNAETDSPDESRQSPLGRASHLRRIDQTRHRYWRDQRQQYLVRQREAAIADVADFLENHVKTMVSVDFFTGAGARAPPDPSLRAVVLVSPGVGEVVRANAGYFFGGVADASCFVNLMVIDFFSPEPSFMNSVNV